MDRVEAKEPAETILALLGYVPLADAVFLPAADRVHDLALASAAVHPAAVPGACVPDGARDRTGECAAHVDRRAARRVGVRAGRRTRRIGAVRCARRRQETRAGAQ